MASAPGKLASREGSASLRDDLDLELLGADQVPPVSRELRLLAERVQAAAERHVPKIVALNRALPELREIRDQDFWEEVEEIARLNVPLFYRVMLDGWSPTEEEVAANRAYTRRCVQREISLGTHLAAYREGMWLLWSHLVQEVLRCRPALRGELLLRTVWVLRHFEAVSAALSQAYYAEQEGRSRHRHAALLGLLDEILQGGPSPAEELRARASALRLELEAQHHMVVVVARPGRGAPLAAAAGPAVARATGVPAAEVIAVERGHEVVLFARRSPQRDPLPALREELDLAFSGAAGTDAPADVRAGISGAVAGIEGVRRGYREAQRALELGAELEPARAVWLYAELALHDLLLSNALAGRRLVEEVLGPLLACRASGRRHVATLDAYFRAGLCLKEAAAQLAIHPNTLLYRMRQIRRVAGVDPANADQRLRLEVALRLLAREPSLWPDHKAAAADS